MELLDAESFYAELTLRNRGFIDPAVQSALGAAHVLVAGCGSTGGAAVEPLVRLGVGALTLADNGSFELNNLNRQPAGHGDVRRNKCEVAAERAGAINPYARLTAEPDGITERNVLRLVERADVVVDGVDVTERSGWQAKLLLHQAAVRFRRPVITGYDMAGMQFVRFYDYRRPGSRAFDGRIDERRVAATSTWALLLRVIPLRHIPWEMIKDARANLDDPEYRVPQVVYASLLFGAIAGRATVDIVAGRRIARHTVVDAHDVVRTRGGRLGARARWLAELLGAAPVIARLRREGETARHDARRTP